MSVRIFFFWLGSDIKKHLVGGSWVCVCAQTGRYAHRGKRKKCAVGRVGSYMREIISRVRYAVSKFWNWERYVLVSRRGNDKEGDCDIARNRGDGKERNV